MQPCTRILTPIAIVATITLAPAGCGDSGDRMSMREDRYRQTTWDREDVRRERWETTRESDMAYRTDYDGRPLERDASAYRQIEDVEGADLDLRSPYSGDRYEEMGRYGNTPR